MRLTDIQRKKITESIYTIFGEKTEFFLFGSRVDDNQKGGDIDLLVIDKKNQFDQSQIFEQINKTKTKIQIAIGDQKIDILVSSDPEHDTRLVVKEAIKTGIRL